MGLVSALERIASQRPTRGRKTGGTQGPLTRQKVREIDYYFICTREFVELRGDWGWRQRRRQSQPPSLRD